ncbi:MAG TPA: FtsX-like permease family protein [Puia sp.]|jgi:ABC-type lipoprotein release transport system permease subunit|nr:FtsX-like permease family protein [Puia sp.]
MLKNYFTVAWRNLLRSKWYSLINTLGLSIGLAVALLIGLWIWDELSFDHYYENHSRVAQVMTTQTFNGRTGTGEATSLPVGKTLRTQFAGDFSEVARCSWTFDHTLAVGDRMITQMGMYAEPGFSHIITLRMVKGSRDALKDPSAILLTQSAATALFGNEDPMNKTVKIDNLAVAKVEGIFEDPPRNTSFSSVKFLLTWAMYESTADWVRHAEDQWGNHSWPTFVLMAPKADPARVTARIKDLPKAHNKEGDETLLLQPMDNWHLYSDFKDGKVSGGLIRFVWLFAIIGVFVLLLACINFMNLSTARSEKRAKEVGIRKTVGSLRTQLIGQFLCESIVVALLAFVLAIGWVLLALPSFNTLADKDMHLPWANPVFWVLTLGFTLVTGLLAGSYPAFYLSGFDPIRVLKGAFRAGRFASLPRKVLVVLQFTVSVALIIGTILVFSQINYARNRPVGYSREGLISIMMNTPEIFGHYNALRGDLLRTGAVADMCESSSPITNVWSNQIGWDWKGKDPQFVPLFGTIACTHDYGKTLDWSIKEGRDFSRNFVTDSGGRGGLILNEAAVKLTGMSHPLGETITWNDSPRVVIGIVRDMVMENPYQPIKPTIFFISYGWTNVIDVRLNPSMSARAALRAIAPVFKRYNPGSAFEYKFVDEEYARKFTDEQRIGRLATVFAVLAIFISCLGLFGLASFVAEQRTREIGVRKVLGASLFHLWGMLSADFVLLVVISCAIAVPVAWYFLHQWLKQYEYRTPMYWWAFVGASLGALAITLLTVSYQAVRAGMANPVKALRSE